jgi:hypothetical protein
MITTSYHDVPTGVPGPECFGCCGTGTLRWAGIPEGIRCSCVEHAADCEPGTCAPNCPSRGEAEHGFPQRCTCCDDRLFHFADLSRSVHAVDLLRDWLASPFRVEGVGIDLHDGPEFVNARDAQDWLDEHDRVTFVGRMIQDALELRSGRAL